MARSSILTTRVPAAAFAAALALGAGSAVAQPVPATPPAEYNIGYVDLLEDPRFDPVLAYFETPTRPAGPALPGAELSIQDGALLGQAINTNFSLQSHSAADTADIVSTIQGWAGEGINFVVVDLPADTLLEVSDGVASLPVTLLNASAPEDRLRSAQCRMNVVHFASSFRMWTDAMVQYLTMKRWRNILILQGPNPEDQELVTALQQSAARFGARIVDVRPFVLSNDPRNREQSNVALMTAGLTYDVLYIADVDGEFGRSVPYETNDPRLVVGTAGLVAHSWHWSWERQGAPQLNDRFEDLAGRRMTDSDWGAWVAVKAVVQSVVRSRSTAYDEVLAYMLGERMNLDGAKGNPLSVRPWDHQVRQGMLIAGDNVIVQLAPVEGFLHQTNDLDTLGVDQPESSCRF